MIVESIPTLPDSRELHDLLENWRHHLGRHGAFARGAQFEDGWKIAKDIATDLMRDTSGPRVENWYECIARIKASPELIEHHGRLTARICRYNRERGGRS